MKKIVFLMFVIVSVIAANAQTSPNNSIGSGAEVRG